MESIAHLVHDSGVARSPHLTTEARVIRNERYYLCDDAESYLESAMEEGATLIIENYLVLKFIGRTAALCTKSFTASDGTRFKRGKWYSPASGSRDEFRKLFNEGHRHVSIPAGTDFIKVRSVKKSGLTEKALAHANSVPRTKLNEDETRTRNDKLKPAWYYV